MGYAYNDQSIPAGGFTTKFYTGTSTPTAVESGADYVIEEFTPNRNGNAINRPDEFGGPNGFAVVATQQTGSCTIQVIDAAKTLPPIGAWFQKKIEDETSGTVEQWVIISYSGPTYSIGGYRKATAQLQLCKTNNTIGG